MSNETKQTAVQSLCGKLAMKLGIPQAITFYIDHQKEISEALEMEKEQMCKFAYKCHNHHKVYGDFNIEDYYNETYGGNK
jgi:hypothetical protein